MYAPLPPETRQKIIDAYQRGESMDVICASLEISRSVIYKVLRSECVQYRTHREPPHPRTKTEPVQVQVPEEEQEEKQISAQVYGKMISFPENGDYCVPIVKSRADLAVFVAIQNVHNAARLAEEYLPDTSQSLADRVMCIAAVSRALQAYVQVERIHPGVSDRITIHMDAYGVRTTYGGT